MNRKRGTKTAAVNQTDYVGFTAAFCIGAGKSALFAENMKHMRKRRFICNIVILQRDFLVNRYIECTNKHLDLLYR